MPRPICFDITHTVSRLGIPAPSGIDNVDLAYARAFSDRASGPFIHYGLKEPHVLSRSTARGIIEQALAASWQSSDIGKDVPFSHVRSALTNKDGGRGAPTALTTRRPSFLDRARAALARASLEAQRLRLRMLSDGGPVPENAIYLNVAQHAFETHRFFEWLVRRPDVSSVFLIHDLLPLDYPEYFRPGYKALFTRRVDTMMTHGRAFIVTSDVVAERVREELACRKLPGVPIRVAPLPSSLKPLPANELADPELAAVPYFVTVGTIEPRKNHLLLLNIWRQLAEGAHAQPVRATGGGGTTPFETLPQAFVPKLVIIGSRGWENEQVLDVLDRGLLTRPYVIEAAGLSSAGLSLLIANARALLMPSCAEGYGLPLVEALALGTPVVATDARVFREVTQGCAQYRSATDGIGWKHLITELTDPGSETSRNARAAAEQFKAPSWDGHFAEVLDHLTERL